MNPDQRDERLRERSVEWILRPVGSSSEGYADLGEFEFASGGAPSQERIQLFFDTVMPILDQCRQFSLERDGRSIPPELMKALLLPDVRAIAWGYLRENGIEGDLTQGQKHALVVGLLPYLDEEASEGFSAIERVLDSVVQVRDYRLYEVLGEHVLTMLPPLHINQRLLRAFLALSTHNAEKDVHFKPWIELFSHHGDSVLYSSIMAEVLERVRNSELSSYDHLLDVICNPRSLKSPTALLDAMNPPSVFQEEPSPLKPSLGTIAITLCENAVLVFPFTVGISYVFRGFGDGFISQAIGSTLLASAVTAYFELKLIKSFLEEQVSKQFSFFRGGSFTHLAERTYSKLWKLRDVSSEAQEILLKMEEQPLFKSHIGAWREAATVN